MESNGIVLVKLYNRSEQNFSTGSEPEHGTDHIGGDWLINAHNLWDDAIWILTTSYIILTMQSGFGLIEVGAINSKHMTNVLVKNVVDILFGGLSFWMFGYGLAFGQNDGPAWRNNPFIGFGRMFVYANVDEMGSVYAHFLFQMASCVTATTLVSGSMAERGKLAAYIVFCFFNTAIFAVQAHWVWDPKGWLRQLGAMDAAGSGVVHLMGATSSLVTTIIVKPRIGRYDKSRDRLTLANDYSVLGSLVSISAAVTLCKPMDALIIGTIGGLCVCFTLPLLDRIGIDDPVGTFSTHGVTGIWGMLATGLFAEAGFQTERVTGGYAGLFLTGDWTLLKLQVFACLAITGWTVAVTTLLLLALNHTVGLRVTVEEELRGADMCEHGLEPRKPARELGDEDFLKSDQVRQRIIDFVNKSVNLSHDERSNNRLDQQKMETIVTNIAFKRSHTISSKDADAFEFLAQKRKLNSLSLKVSARKTNQLQSVDEILETPPPPIPAENNRNEETTKL